MVFKLTVIKRGLSPVKLPKALVAFGGHFSSCKKKGEVDLFICNYINLFLYCIIW